MAGILAIIPAFNEQDSIVEVVSDIRKHIPDADILVVNDASTDLTSGRARQAGAIVMDMPFNVGIGAIMQTGFKYCVEHGYSWAVQVDADSQHRAVDVMRLHEALIHSGAAMAIASRFIERDGYISSAPRRVGIVFFRWLIFVMTGTKVTDPTSGFRMFSAGLVRVFAEDYAEDYPEPQSAVVALRRGFTIVEIPVTMDARKTGSSSITPLKAVYYMLKVTMAIVNSACAHPGKKKNNG